MHARLAACAVLVIAFAAACGTSAVRVYDVWFDRGVDFAALRTFAVRPIATSTEVSGSLARDTEAAVRAHLGARGYREVEGGADFTVAVEIEFVTERNTRSNLRTGAAAVRFTVLAGARSVEVWRALGTVEKAAKSTERAERIRGAVDLTLQRFPPRPEDY